MQNLKLLGDSGVTGNTVGTAVNIDNNAINSGIPNRCYSASIIGSGAVAGTFTFFGSVDGVNFSATPFGTITLSGTAPQTDNFASVAPWRYVKCTLAGSSGTITNANSVCSL